MSNVPEAMPRYNDLLGRLTGFNIKPWLPAMTIVQQKDTEQNQKEKCA